MKAVRMKTLLTVCLTLAMATLAFAQEEMETLDTRVGKLSFTHDFANGYPTDATQKLLFEEMDFQRACQAYIWSIPIVAMAQWQCGMTEKLGAKNGQMVFKESYEDKLGVLTANTTTPYVVLFIDVTDETWITVMPEGEVRGAVNDFWQIGVKQMTTPGKYLFVGPGQEVPKGAEKDGYIVVKNGTSLNK